MRRTSMVLACLVAAALLPSRAAAQLMPEAAAFFERARAAAARYPDPASAALDGYRPIGPDFPSMGVHWVSIALVAQDTLDPDAPQILEFATLNGRPTLVGVAWALPIRPGRPVPDWPAGRGAWHYHSGAVDEESFVASHGDPSHHPPDGPTVAVLHAWTGVANPDGPFATDNWALPWARAGLAPPAEASRDAARMVALAAGGDHYFATLFRLVVRPEPGDTAALASALERGRAAGQAMLARMQAAGSANAADVAALAAAWRNLLDDAGRVVSVGSRERLLALRE